MPHLLFVQVRKPSSEYAKANWHLSQFSLSPAVLYKHSNGSFGLSGFMTSDSKTFQSFAFSKKLLSLLFY